MESKVKRKGDPRYKTGSIEPIDLFEASGMLKDFALANIIKYAHRNRKELNQSINIDDMRKIIHYAEIMIELENGWKRKI